MAREMNPMEALVEEASDFYVQIVFDLVEDMAPERPWWTVELTPDQQLWRWHSGPRDEIMEWIYEAGRYMGWKDDEILKNLQELFTSPRVEALVPLDVQSRVPVALLEMVQASGPQDAANHIRKMERMVAGRMEAFEVLEANRPAFEEVEAAAKRIGQEEVKQTETLYGVGPS